jgi:DNA-binding NarL/FixJ family response regulator
VPESRPLGFLLDDHDSVVAALARLSKLTPREHLVLELVARGLMNRQIAVELGATEKTIKVQLAQERELGALTTARVTCGR